MRQIDLAEPHEEFDTLPRTPSRLERGPPLLSLRLRKRNEGSPLLSGLLKEAVFTSLRERVAEHGLEYVLPASLADLI